MLSTAKTKEEYRGRNKALKVELISKVEDPENGNPWLYL